MSNKRPTIVIVDDDEALMRCVGIVLGKEEHIHIVGQATHAQAGVAMAEALLPDVVLMDIHMPGADPFDACTEIIHKTKRDTRVLFYSAFPKDQYLDRCIAAGASGLVSKHSESIQNLGLAIRHVIAGNSYFSPELTNRLVELKNGRAQSRLSTLSQRELEVLREVASGKTQPEIAEVLGVSERTINNRVGDIKQKLAIPSLNDLLLYAINEGLVFPELQAK